MSILAHKRRAEDDLQSEQRLSKRFDLLNLDHSSKLYTPAQKSRPKHSSSTNGDSDSMQLDDTKDKIYIHNLDDEISDIESEEERLVFLPDIEKKLAKVPKSVLLGESHPATGGEMILYGIPTSLTVPEEQDNVRKAIIESRARAREKQLQAARANGEAVPVNGTTTGAATVDKQNGIQNLGHVAEAVVADLEEDEDAMDLG